jgi:hypothetical protein
MRYPSPFPILVLSLFVAQVAQAQTSSTQLPRELDGVWELVAVDGQPLPLAPVRAGGDPTGCGEHGEYAGQRVGEGRLVLRADEMWMSPRSGRWEGGVYMYVPEEIICRAAGGALILLRRDVHNRAHPALEVQATWRTGSYGLADSTPSLSIDDREWTLARTGPSTFSLTDDEGNAWAFRRAPPGPQFETPGFASVLGDFDGDGRADQVLVRPGRHGSGTMLGSLAEGPVQNVTDVPEGAEVILAPRGRTWRNADGTTLRLTDRDAVLVSAEPVPGRSDVTLYHLRNGTWVAWEYSPD